MLWDLIWSLRPFLEDHTLLGSIYTRPKMLGLWDLVKKNLKKLLVYVVRPDLETTAIFGTRSKKRFK